MNCRHPSSGYLSSEIAYFPSSPNSSPGARALTAFESTTIWEGGAPVTASFGSNSVSVSIQGDVPVGSFAGTAKNNYPGIFNCMRTWRQGLYTTPEGASCDMIYECNHKPPPGYTSQVSFTLQPSIVTLDIKSPNGAADIYWAIWSQRKANYCDKSEVAIPGSSCSVRFECDVIDANDRWTTTNGFADFLLRAVAPAVTGEKVKRKCVREQFVDHSKLCIQWEDQHFTTMPEEIRINVQKNPPSGQRLPVVPVGSLTAKVKCEKEGGQTDCFWCKQMTHSLEAMAVNPAIWAAPEVAVWLGAGAILGNVACDLCEKFAGDAAETVGAGGGKDEL